MRFRDQVSLAFVLFVVVANASLATENKLRISDLRGDKMPLPTRSVPLFIDENGAFYLDGKLMSEDALRDSFSFEVLWDTQFDPNTSVYTEARATCVLYSIALPDQWPRTEVDSCTERIAGVLSQVRAGATLEQEPRQP